MDHPRLLSRLLPLLVLVLAACDRDQPPTGPSAPRGPAFDHTPGHKVVNSLADPGNGPCNATQCTLREAIEDPGSTEISFAPGLTGTITLAPPGAGGGRLEIDKQLTIVGPSQRIVIRGRSPDLAFPVFHIGPGGTVRLTNLTIQAGGTGIVNRRTLTLINSVVAENSGTGILSTGNALAITNSFVVDNLGAGIDVRNNSTATLTNTRVARNSAGGISVFNANATLTNSTVAGNSAPEDGGGISIRDGSTVTLTRTTVNGNSAGESGGGIANQALGFGRAGVSLTLTNSTVSGNSAVRGGGIFNGNFIGEATAALALTNSTVARNSAAQAGGGIDLAGDGGLSLINSLVAQNRAPTAPDVHKGEEAGIFARFNLIGNGTGSGITNTDGNQVGNVSPNTSPLNPRLGPLADNGGPTRTHALLLGSPAIDAASTLDCPTTDQRGVLRPQGAACDIGSYERK